jgi:hypothetical protein
MIVLVHGMYAGMGKIILPKVESGIGIPRYVYFGIATVGFPGTRRYFGNFPIFLDARYVINRYFDFAPLGISV